ncbi:MAG: phenylacetate--CoA ligase family protein [Candidatus Cloacimonetes bacterium]|nr:phenylacetate--CoA ligase family protein [Candidatus Cloacimonadota bacterium]
MIDATKIIDLLSGKQIGKYYQIYDKSQWYSPEEMRVYQISKLKRLLTHCYAHVPYYRNLMISKSIFPSDVRDLAILQEFPIITKEQIKAEYDRFMPNNEHQIKGIKTSQTGGTTGNILYKRNDARTRSSVWASYKRFYDWMGIRPGDRVMNFWGGHVIKHGWKDTWIKRFSDLLRNSVSLDAYDTRPEIFDEIVNTLKNKHIRLIRSYPQALYSLAKKLDEQGLTFDIKAILTTSEPLMPQHRELFRKVFNAGSFDQYGCGEIGGIAYECAEHNGLHVTEERVILESNEKDELLITDLDNYAMPYIRYWNADQAIFSDELCPCGRKSRLISQVMGRTCDYLTGVNGQILHWAYFWHLLFDTNIAIDRNFIKFQIVQKAPDLIVFRTVSDPLTDIDKETLIRMIHQKMGNMRVEFVLEEDIPNTPSGKYRPVINELL